MPKSCSVGLLCVSFLNINQFVCVCTSIAFGIESEVWDLILLIPDYYFSIYFVLVKMVIITILGQGQKSA